jgi:PTH1 family peptidyl-tRNA hydrolase|tara:strand:- start:6083 stop:6691 length:609 start_codon:yes stop_codon:yes gene_type:complete
MLEWIVGLFKKKELDPMKFLIVGLGNIGPEYNNTRHNIGFDVLDQWVKEHNAAWDTGRLANVATFKFRGKQIIAIKPTTFMNLSGKAVKHWMSAERIQPKNLLVITDDIAIDVGKLRIRGKGSPGGHNGLKDIQAELGSDTYDRIRFGAGGDFPRGRQIEHVLGQWDKNEEIEVVLQKDRACKAIESWIIKGLNGAMNEFSG